MARERGRRTFTLEDEAHALLDGVGNISEYVGKLILQHGRDWTESLARLRECGWQAEEILAACEALQGYGLSNFGRNGAFLAEELERLEQVSACFASRDVAAVRRRWCLKQLATDFAVAHALVTVAREYNLPNENCKAAVRRHPTQAGCDGRVFRRYGRS